MAREKGFSEMPAHYKPLYAVEAQEGVVRIPCLVADWNIFALASDSIQALELEMGRVSRARSIDPGEVPEVSGNNALVEQEMAHASPE